MNRQAARELAATTLTNLGTYQAVYEGARRKFGGISPVASILSKSLQIVPEAADVFSGRIGITATIYVRCDEGTEDTTEDQLDTLVEAALTALKNAGFLMQASDSAPENAPLRNVDGVYYRVEQLLLTYEEDY